MYGILRRPPTSANFVSHLSRCLTSVLQVLRRAQVDLGGRFGLPSVLALPFANVPRDRAAHHGAWYHSSLQPCGCSPPRVPHRFGSSAKTLTTTAAARTSMLARPLATLSRDGIAHHAAWDRPSLLPPGYNLLRGLGRFEPEWAWQVHLRCA